MSKSDLSARLMAPVVLRYGLSVLSVAISMSATLLLQGSTFRTPLFFPAILLSTWFGGTGPGLLSVLLSTLCINFFILDPKLSFSFGLHDIPHLVVFLFTALLVSSWSATRRRAEHALQRARDELEAKVQGRTADLSRSNEQLRIEISERERAEEALRASEQVARGQVEALAQSLDVLATAPEPEKFIGQMLSTIGRLLNAQSVSLCLFDESADSLVLRSMVDGGKLTVPDPQNPFIKDPLLWKQNLLFQELLFMAGPVVCDDVEADPRIRGEWRDYLKQKGTKRFLAVPILVGGQVKGFVGVRHADRASYRPEEIELTQALAHQVMLAIQLNEFAEQGQRAAVFEERNRMARDIHDTLAQGFTGVIVQLEAAEDAVSSGYRKEADAHLHRAGELARRSLSEARRSVHALRPRALEHDNFWEALKGIIKSTTAGTALHTTCELRGKLPELPPIWQKNLLHIGQEALTNALKYAHAKNFRTRLSCNAKGVRLELRDDGAGFELKGRHDGLGLTGMHERVEQMNGELEITSARGEGTKVVVALPLNQESML